MTTYITTTIPYVNARPHLGFALELVQADVLARHKRAGGQDIRFQAGSELALDLAPDDVTGASRDRWHRPGVERLWHACAANGDFYKPDYAGLYCGGCQQFFPASGLSDGTCPEHGTTPEVVSRENWYFRLSRYADRLHSLISGGAIRIEPARCREEVLRFIESGLRDFPVSRTSPRPGGSSRAGGSLRSGGWGIPVPGDTGQAIYLWWDALASYITSLSYATYGGDYDRWWTGSDRRVHLIGNGVLRFHAVYWPAMLLSAGEALPTDIYVHDNLTAGGRTITKSGATGADPAALAAAYGTDAVRWWLLREAGQTGDTGLSAGRLVARAHDELASGLGNLVNRVVAMVHRYRGGEVPNVRTPDPRAAGLTGAVDGAPAAIAAALDRCDFRAASGAVWVIVEEASEYVNLVQPWTQGCHRRDQVLTILLAACRALGAVLEPFLPQTAARVIAQTTPVGGALPAVAPVPPLSMSHRQRSIVVGDSSTTVSRR